MIQAALFHNRGVYDDLIIFDERSEHSVYTHVAFKVGGDTFNPFFLEAYPGAGVRRREFVPGDTATFDLCDIRGITTEIEEKIMGFFERTKGEPYDWIGAFDFAFGLSDERDNVWFCSKWCFAALADAGLPPLLRITKGRVRPSEFSQSPIFPAATYLGMVQ